MTEPLRIGVKYLASMAMPDFCKRCLWYRLHCGDGPFSFFPGIFSSIDAMTKKTVHASIDKNGHAPKWLGAFSKATSYENVGFLKWLDEKNNILLRGAPDDVLYKGKKEESYVVDYKTARHSAGQDRLLPLYRVQVLGYAFLLEQNGHKKPDRTALIYFEPPSDPTQTELLANTAEDGFRLPLTVEVVEFQLGEYSQIHSYLNEIRRIFDKRTPPKGYEGCRDCGRIDNFLREGTWDDRPERGIVKDYINGSNGRVLEVPKFVRNDPSINTQDSGEWHPSWEDDEPANPE